jgi:flagellar protein FlbD
MSGEMIKLTRLDGECFVLNAELIRYVEQRPDTFITLTSGERFVVSETVDRVVDLAVHYQQQKHLIPPLPPSQSVASNLPRTTGLKP